MVTTRRQKSFGPNVTQSKRGRQRITIATLDDEVELEEQIEIDDDDERS